MFGFLRSLFGDASHKNKGMRFLEEKRFEEAVSELKEAVVSSPRDETSLLSLSQALFELKRFEDAIEYLTAAAENASSINPVPAIMLGYAYYKIEKVDEARSTLERAMKIDSKHPAARYYMGLVHLKSGNIDAATDEFEEVISEKPTFIQARLLAIGEMFIIQNEKNKKI
jgi:tetratricopeptide (TPR) repeat protein